MTSPRPTLAHPLGAYVPTSDATPAGPIRPLTPRQREIAEAIGRGLSYAEIGAALGCATRTVEAHVRQIYALIDSDLPPRYAIFLWVKHEEWQRGRGGT